MLRCIIKTNKHNVEVAVEDAEVEVETELLLRGELLDSLHMFKLKRQAFLLFKRMLLLLFTIESLVFFTVNVHAFEDDRSLLDAHFHVDILQSMLLGIILDREKNFKLLTSGYFPESGYVIERTISGYTII